MDVRDDKEIMKEQTFLLGESSSILSSIYRISSLLTQPSPIDRVLNSIMETVTESLGFYRAALYLVHKEKELLECKWISGFTPEQEERARRKPYHLGRHECLETKVALTGKPILVKDVIGDPGLTKLDIDVTRYFGRGCILYVPLKVKGTTIGILGVDKKKGTPWISEQEFESLSIFANYASIIIENSRLYEALLNEKKFSENVLSSSVHGILTVDVEGRITSLNPAAEDFLDVRRENILEKSIADVLPAIPEMHRMLERTLTNIEDINAVECSLKKGAAQAILHVSSSPLMDDGGHLIGILFLVQDITGERERDAYLQRVNRLISLGELAAGVAHEIRNPLTGIGVVLDLLKGRKRLSKSDEGLLEEASGEIERLERLISDLLDFARPKKFNFEMGNINDVIKSIHTLINEQCNKQNVRLVTKYGRKIPKLNMDTEKIRQGLLNIVINSIQAMPSGGRLSIETNCLDGFDYTDERRFVTVTIADTGSGIPETIKDRVFNPFFTTHGEGTGLGLSITHSIVKEHKGMIRFDTEEGKGTRFIVSLPVGMEGIR